MYLMLSSTAIAALFRHGPYANPLHIDKTLSLAHGSQAISALYYQSAQLIYICPCYCIASYFLLPLLTFFSHLTTLTLNSPWEALQAISGISLYPSTYC